MSDNDINIYNQKTKRKTGKFQSHQIDKTVLNLNWITKVTKAIKKNIEQPTDNPIYIKKELEAEEMTENAKIHCEANRPLKKIKEFDNSTKFCQCCYNPMKDQIHVTNFNFCDSTDEFAVFGTGISLYFFYLKYAIIILFFSLFMMSLPSILLSKKYTEDLINICEIIYLKEGDNINNTFPYCNGFTNINEDAIIYNNQIIFLLKFNSMNIKNYREIYLNITNGDENINKVLSNYHLIYFIGLITLFIIHSIYTILLFNINKQYDLTVTSPSDYAVIITNLQSAFELFCKEISNINKLIIDYNKKNYSINNNNYYLPEDDRHFERTIYKKLQTIGLEKFEKYNEANISEGFKEFLKNIICGNENGKPYNIYLINICYKINEFKSIKEKIEEDKNKMFIAKTDPEQIQKNINLDLPENKMKYFYHPLDILDLYVCPFTLYEKDIRVTKIEKEKLKLEKKLKRILNNTENLTEENFSGVVFIIFNSIEEKDKFLDIHSKNLILTLINSLSNLKYYICNCCINSSKRKKFFLKQNISIDDAPEPEDLIYENLEFSWVQRLLRVLLVYIISFILISLCFFFILYLNSVQIEKSQSADDNIVYRYGWSTFISLIIAAINAIFQNILIILTQMEKQICMTNFFLSYSIKLTILTFCSSVLIPFISNNYYNDQLNNDILITNCFTMFLSNSFLIPITWTINFEFFLKKLRRCIIKKKNKRLPQKELNNLFELLDMDIASKYSYVTRTLLMCFFYLPIFPLGIPICCIGFIFSFFLEKYNFVKMYKKPIMLNSRIIEVYSNYFLINLFMISLGEYLFLKDVFSSNFWALLNIILFSVLLIIPYNSILSIDLIKINESDLKGKELYENSFFNFFIDYERNNPITKKEGIQHFLDKLLEKMLITQNDYDTILQNYEDMNLLEIYYKYKLQFGQNLLKRAFVINSNLPKKQNETNNVEILNTKQINSSKSILEKNNQKVSKYILEDVEEEQYIQSSGNNTDIKNQNITSRNGDNTIHYSIKKNNKYKTYEVKVGKNLNNYIDKEINEFNINNDVSNKHNDDSQRKLINSKRNMMGKEEINNNDIVFINYKKKKRK